MPSKFTIQADWVPGEFERDDIAATMAELCIKLDDRTATDIEDTWSRSVRPTVRLSALPLAMWFASSWWRLRWEPRPSNMAEIRTAWRMAHEMPAAGHGFIWPVVSFESDGNSIDVRCVPTQYSDSEPIRYLSGLHTSVGVEEFEQVIDEFIQLVIERLRLSERESFELADLWAEVRSERADREVYEYRKIEALLGFDPDEAPADLIDRLLSMSSRAGHRAITEIAAMGGRDKVADDLQQLIDISETRGLQASMSNEIEQIRPACTLDSTGQAPPWELGRTAASQLRSLGGLGDAPLSDGDLAQLFSIDATLLSYDDTPDRPPIGLAVRNGSSAVVNLHFRKRHRRGRRFEAARFIAEKIFAPAEESWLPVSDSKTYRQKVQRSFAAEFLAPISGLKCFLNGDFSPDATDEAAGRFGLSSLAIRSHLANHGLIWPHEVSV